MSSRGRRYCCRGPDVDRGRCWVCGRRVRRMCPVDPSSPAERVATDVEPRALLVVLGTDARPSVAHLPRAAPERVDRPRRLRTSFSRPVRRGHRRASRSRTAAWSRPCGVGGTGVGVQGVVGRAGCSRRWRSTWWRRSGAPLSPAACTRCRDVSSSDPRHAPALRACSVHPQSSVTPAASALLGPASTARAGASAGRAVAAAGQALPYKRGRRLAAPGGELACNDGRADRSSPAPASRPAARKALGVGRVAGRT